MLSRFGQSQKKYINDINLPAPDNLLVTEAAEKSAQRISNGAFFYNGLYHRRMYQCMISISGVLWSVSVDVILNCLYILELFVPK